MLGSVNRATGSTNVNSQSRSIIYAGYVFLLSSVLVLRVVLTLCKCDFYVSVKHMLYSRFPWSKNELLAQQVEGVMMMLEMIY